MEEGISSEERLRRCRRLSSFSAAQRILLCAKKECQHMRTWPKESESWAIGEEKKMRPAIVTVVLDDDLQQRTDKYERKWQHSRKGNEYKFQAGPLDVFVW